MVVMMMMMLRRVQNRAGGANGCSRCGLLHVEVENVLRHDAEARVWLWQLWRRVRVGLGLGLALDGVHRSVNVHTLRLTVIEVDGGKLYLIDARECRGVHLEGVQREPKSRSGTRSTKSKTRAVVH